MFQGQLRGWMMAEKETKQCTWAMRHSECEVWAGRKDEKVEPGWGGRTESTYKKSFVLFLMHLYMWPSFWVNF